MKKLLSLLTWGATVSAAFEPQVVILDDEQAVGAYVAGEIASTIRMHNDNGEACCLGLATGSTPIPTYKELTRLYKEDSLDFSRVNTFNLDEYVGLSEDHPQSYRYFMDEQLFAGLMSNVGRNTALNPAHVHMPPSGKNRGEAAILASEYETLLNEVGPADIQILGIGENGHIAFCEPGSPRNGLTSIVPLSNATRAVNARFFDGDMSEVPTHAVSMGIGSILKAKRIILIATGGKKRTAISRALRGPVNEACPASLLRLHPNVTFALDSSAASEL